MDVPVLNHPTQVVAGDYFSCALTDDGVKCWGINEDGVTNVPLVSGVTQMTAGVASVCVSTMDDGIRCWGAISSKNTVAETIRSPKMISVGNDSACALTDGGVKCWGRAPGRWENPFKNFKQVTQLSTIDNEHMCALVDQSVHCFGGNGERESDVPALIDPIATEVSERSSCALDKNGFQCWGNSAYRLGEAPKLIGAT